MAAACASRCLQMQPSVSVRCFHFQYRQGRMSPVSKWQPVSADNGYTLLLTFSLHKQSCHGYQMHEFTCMSSDLQRSLEPAQMTGRKLAALTICLVHLQRSDLCLVQAVQNCGRQGFFCSTAMLQHTTIVFRKYYGPRLLIGSAMCSATHSFGTK